MPEQDTPSAGSGRDVTEDEKLVGWKSIANHLVVSVRTAQRLANEPLHPLPVWIYRRSVFTFVSEIEAWIAGAKPVRVVWHQGRRSWAAEREQSKSPRDPDAARVLDDFEGEAARVLAAIQDESGLVADTLVDSRAGAETETRDESRSAR